MVSLIVLYCSIKVGSGLAYEAYEAVCAKSPPSVTIHTVFFRRAGLKVRTLSALEQ
jgi:hypothetical protein